jgi:hypothetical protein
MARGCYARRFSEHGKKHVWERAMDAETTEYATARKVRIACEDFLREREKLENRQHENHRPRR